MKVVESTDDAFYPIERQLGMIEEDPSTAPFIMGQFKSCLIDKGIKVKKNDFTYFTQESITEKWMKMYYEDYTKDSIVARYVRKLFSEEQEIISMTRLAYRSLLWSKDKKRFPHIS